MPKNKEVITSDFYCTKCGNKGIPIARKIGKQKEPGHLKKLYCLYCKEEVNFVEVKEYGNTYTKEDFDLEYNFGNFSSNGDRKLPYKQFRKEIIEGENLYV